VAQDDANRRAEMALIHAEIREWRSAVAAASDQELLRLSAAPDSHEAIVMLLLADEEFRRRHPAARPAGGRNVRQRDPTLQLASSAIGGWTLAAIGTESVNGFRLSSTLVALAGAALVFAMAQAKRRRCSPIRSRIDGNRIRLFGAASVMKGGARNHG
jgi:hypothetical protein